MRGDLLAELTEGRPHGIGERAGCLFQLLSGCGVPKSARDRLRYLIPSPDQRGERALDLLLRGPAVSGDTGIGGLEVRAEFAKSCRDVIPGIGLALRRRIWVVLLHVLDGTYELFRAHYGRKESVIGADGADIRATLGIIVSTLALLREPRVTHLAASFDTVIESFRNDMFAGYKIGAGIEEELLAQFPLAEDAIESIGVVVWRNIEFEADDALATAAIRWVEDVEQVVIVTPDKDLTQAVVGNRIVT